MAKIQRQLAILNLSGELPEELKGYFVSRGIEVSDPADNHVKEWTHILTRDLHEFDHLNLIYDLIEKDRKLISLSKVLDLKNFAINNGNLILEEKWFEAGLGAFILDKYLQNYGGINLGDNYPTFTECGSFKVANPFNTGEYLDRMVQSAHESGVDALSVKTYFDHLMMYVTNLKNKGKAGLPFEVTYGKFDGVYGVQVHFYSRNLVLSDFTTSLNSGLSRKAEEYFLNVALQSADFFDFSYLPDVNKTIVTSLWREGDRLSFENNGFMFSIIDGEGPAVHYQESENTTVFLTSSGDLNDLSEKIAVGPKSEEPSNISAHALTEAKEVDAAQVVSGEQVENFSQVVSGTLPKAEDSQVVNGVQEKNGSQVVEGHGSQDSVRERNISQTVIGRAEEEPATQTIAGVQEEDASSETIKGEFEGDEAQLVKGKTDIEEFLRVVKGELQEDKNHLVFSGEKFDIETATVRIANKVRDLSKEKNMSLKSLGTGLQQTIKTGLFDFARQINKEVDDLKPQDMELFQAERVPEIIRNELERIMSSSSHGPEEKHLVSESSSDTKVASLPESSEAKHLQSKLVSATAENEKLRSQLKTLATEVRILKESRNKLAEVQAKARAASAEIKLKGNDNQVIDNENHELISRIQHKLEENDVQKITVLMENIKQEELKVRKLQLEAVQKDTFFAQQLEKAERDGKSKELILIKTKETFTKLVDKKDREIEALKSKVEQLSSALVTNPSSNQNVFIRDLERQNQNLNKQIEMYKVKISSMASNLQPSKSEDALKDEARKLQMLNQQMKNQLDQNKREIEKLQLRLSSESSQILQLKQEKARLEQHLKKAAQEAKEATAVVQNGLSDQELKRLQAQNQILETQLKDSAQKVSTLEAKLMEAFKLQKSVSNPDEGSKVKVTQLETSVKKLTQDLIEAKNQIADAKKETNKLRQEKTALQNQLDKMKKEADKVKSAVPKKPGGKAA